MRCHLAAVALLIALPAPALAQAARDLLPEPGLRVEPAVVPPQDAEAPQPIAPAPADGPSFVLRGIVLRGATAVPEAALTPIWQDLIGQPATLGTLDDIAARIGAAYRARGFVLSQAVLPAQTVDDGVVEIVVVEGFVDRIAITGAAPSQAPLAGTYFAPVAGERPLRLGTLERAVLLARDTFGGTVETVLEPSPGTYAAADLGVLMTPDPYVGFASLDNRGSRLYGQWTLSGGASAYNRFGLNERVDGLVAVAPADGSLAYGQVVLDAPFPSLAGTALDGARLEVAVDASHADPDLTEAGSPDGLTVVLDETNLRAGVIVPFVRTRSANLYGRLNLGWRDTASETAFAGTADTSTDRLAVIEARVTWDLADQLGGVNLIDATVRQGLDIAGARIGDDGPAAGELGFTKLDLTLSRLQRLGADGWSLYGEAIGQASGNVLPNSERFSLGGSTIGRGFAPGNTSGDTGWGARLELRRNLTGNPRLGRLAGAGLYAFADYGRARDASEDRDGIRSESLGSVGVGARIDVRPWLTIIPEIAHQTTGTPSDTTDSDRETRAFVSLVARF